MLRLASASGLLKVGCLALDGTKIKAFSEIASRHGLSSNRAMSYDRMQTEEARLQQEIRDLLAQAETEDQAEDAQHGTNRRGDELPDERQRRESRWQKIREAKAALEAEARAQAAAENAAKNVIRAAEGKEPQSINLDDVQPEPTAQRHFTDPDSKIRQASNKLWSLNRSSSSPPMSRRKPTLSDQSPRCWTRWKPTSQPPRSPRARKISWPTRATTTRRAWCRTRWSRTSRRSD